MMMFVSRPFQQYWFFSFCKWFVRGTLPTPCSAKSAKILELAISYCWNQGVENQEQQPCVVKLSQWFIVQDSGTFGNIC